MQRICEPSSCIFRDRRADRDPLPGESAWLKESTCVAVGQLRSVLRFGLLATAAIVDMTSVVVATTAG
jgi:hypothetical protein